MEPKISRRGFVAAPAAALSASRVRGANDRVRIGIIGTGGRGTYLMREANQCAGIQWAAVCDAWDVRRRKALELTGPGVDEVADYRKLLDRNDIDAVIVATWDNTHARIAMDACRGGKDVYVEKPMTSRPEQGPPLVKAARETGRILQTGVQQRSTPHFLEAKERFFDSGKIGEVHMVRTVWNNNGGYRFQPPPGTEQKPAGLDWDACLGSLPKIPWDNRRYFNRFSYMDLCCGQTGGLLVHMIDVVQWYMGITHPNLAVSLGGIYEFKDGRDTPDNVYCTLEYPQNLVVSFEATVTERTPVDNADIVFFGSAGRLHIFRYGYRFLPAGTREPEAAITANGSRDEHMKNFFDSVRSRKSPNATVEQGHFGAMACHMANEAWKRRSAVAWRKDWDI